MNRISFLSSVLVLIFAGYSAAADPSPKAIEFFEKKVRPILVNRCLDCHSGDSEETDLRLDSRAAIIKGGLRGPSIIPGNPTKSFLMRALRHQERLKMPPKEKLPQQEIATIAAWIKMGAPWPNSGKGSAAAGGAKGKKKKSLEQQRDFWSLQALAPVPLPSVKKLQWVQTPVDRFVLAELEKRGIRPSAAANRRAWLRRVSYDLIGLPPSPDEVRDFILDKSPAAFAKVVDRLLASPRYGERWGRHWLDVARYADSNGLDENLSYANAFHYRDYVVAAMNKDKPFDQFVREQIAGDLMPSQDPAESLERQIATGFLALGAKMLAEDDPTKMQMDIIDEQIDTLGRAFLGLTLGCARCHDHKFDPILTADYYALAGIFKSTKTMENFRVVAKWFERPAATPALARRIAEAKKQIKAINKQIADKSRQYDVKFRQSLIDRSDNYLLAANVTAERNAKIKSITNRITKRQKVAGVILREAEDFNRGNQVKSFDGYGKGIGIIASRAGGNFVEYDIQVAKADNFDLLLRYAAKQARPVELLVNGEKLKSNAAGMVTGSWYPDTQRWVVETRVRLKKGKNLLRIQRSQVFPHIDKILFVPERMLGRVSQLAGTQEKRQMLQPDVVRRWSALLNRTRNDAKSVFADWHQLDRKLRGSSTSKVDAGKERLQFEARRKLAIKYRQLFQAASNPKKAATKKLSTAKVAALKKILNDRRGPFALPKNRRPYYAAEDRQVLVALAARKRKVTAAMPKNLQMAMGVTEGKSADVRIHIRGSHLTLGSRVERNIPVVFRPSKPQARWDRNRSGRLELARWISSDRNPLTSRVIANRLWRWHFGKGLVPSTDNFGRLGRRPSHQSLLNWLAGELVRNDWSLKSVHRAIVLSSTYQMDSRFREDANKKDPENRWMWRFQPRRMEAEAIRDGILYAAGQLDLRMGGTLLRVKNRAYVTTSGTSITDEYKHPRRSIYLPVVRSSLFEMFSTFDFADPTASNGDRSTTTVAPQALFMMNSQFMDEQAASLARRVLAANVQSDDSRLIRLYELTLNRAPVDEELSRGKLFLASIRNLLLSKQKPMKPKMVEQSAWKSLCRVLFSTSEFVYTR